MKTLIVSGLADSIHPVRLARETSDRRYPPAFWVTVAVLAAGASLTTNALLTVSSIIVATAVAWLFRRPGEPPVLLFACAIQWVQVTTVLHYSNFARVDLAEGFGGPQLQWAVWLGLGGVVVLALGARLGMGRYNPAVASSAEREVLTASPQRIFPLYIGGLIILSAIKIAAPHVPQISQLLIATMTIKWVFFFLLAYVVLQRRKRYLLLWVAVAIEFFAGLISYFSAFKSVFFLLIVVLLATRQFWNPRRVLLGGVVCGFLIATSIFWSAIKPDYREFLNQGSNAQEVLVPIPARIDKLQDLATGLTDEGFFQGVDALISRVSYVTYFALTMMNVPDRIPYENGQLWLGAVKHVLMPRLFFPSKAPIDDSERTSYYTGVQFAGEEQGTSISIGYMGESYIDFGPVGMFVPIFGLGVLYGLIYRLLVSCSQFKAVGFAAATSVLLFSAYNLETSNIKLLGGLVVCVIVAAAAVWAGESTLAHAIGLGRRKTG